MEKEKLNNKRVRNYLGVIYEDDEKFDNQLFNLTQEKDSIWIKHDKDLDDEGNVKKPHYHFVIQLKNACTLSSIAKRLEVNENMLEYVKNVNSSLKYLIHYNDDNKYNYDMNDVQSNSEKLKRRFLDLVSKDTPETDKMVSIYEFIHKQNDYIDFNILFKYAVKNNIWDAYRRNYAIIKDLVSDHNGKINAKLYHSGEDFYNNLSGYDL